MSFSESLKALVRPIRALWRGKELEAGIADEINLHIDLLTKKNIKAGMSAEEARQSAVRRFGNTVHIKEKVRETRGIGVVEALGQDLSFGLRMLRKNPGFSAIALLTLALGIGVNSAIFSVVNAVLINPFPFKDQNRLVVAWKSEPAANNPFLELSYIEFTEWREQNHVFEQVATMPTTVYGYGFTLLGEGEPVQIENTRVSANFFDLLGAKPEFGRTFLPEEDNPNGERVVVLSNSLWRQRFGGNTNILGKTLNLSGRGFTVVGVMPQNFDYPHGAELWTPLAPSVGNKASLANRGSIYLQMIGRLKPGVTIDQARAELDSIARRISLQQEPNSPPQGAIVTPLVEHILGNTRPALYLLSAAAALVLLIVCVNVANLLLARSSSRHREIAVRTALGAGRIRLVRQLLTESILLALAGGAVGIVLAYWGIRVLRLLGPADIPRLSEIHVSVSLFAVTFLIAVATAMIFGLAPAVSASKIDLNEALKDGGGKVAGERRSRALRNTLVVAEVALTLVLLIGAGLLLRSFQNLQQVPLGYNPNNLLTMQINLNSPKYRERRQNRQFFRELIQRVESLPGAKSATVMTIRPLEGTIGWYFSFQVEGQALEDAQKNPYLNFQIITPDYFRAMDLPLVAGRSFTEQDNDQVSDVTIISEAMAKRYWPGQDAVGKRLKPIGDGIPWLTVVGVAKDAKYIELNSTKMDIYMPYTQNGAPIRYLVVRTATDPLSMVGAIRNEVSSMDKDQPIISVKPMTQIVNESLAKPRFNMLLLALFAGLAVVLASVGIFGVITYSVSQRTHEIGIRMALGAKRTDLLKLVIAQGMRLVAIGILVGGVSAFLLTRIMAELLYGVSPTDPMIFATISLILIVVSLLACYLPARKATLVDPMTALHYE